MPSRSPEVETMVVRELECELTKTELLERGDAMASCESQIESLKSERRRLNASIREQSDKRSDLGKIIETKHETRDVQCRWVPDYEARQYSLVRQDTGAEIERREMPAADLQTRLVLDQTKSKSSKKSRAN